MNMSFESPVFLLLWIIALLILTVPIIVAGITTAINGYFKAKEQHMSKMAMAFGTALEKRLKDLDKKVD